MSAIGTKRTWPSALHMSAFGGKADIGMIRDGCALVHNGGPKRVAASAPVAISYRAVADSERPR